MLQIEPDYVKLLLQMESDSDSSADFLPDSIKRRIQQENVSIKKPVRKQPEKSIEAQLKEISKYKANAENAIKYHEKIKELELEEIRNSGKGFKLSKVTNSKLIH